MLTIIMRGTIFYYFSGALNVGRYKVPASLYFERNAFRGVIER